MKTLRLAALLLLPTIFLAGCAENHGTNAAPVEVSGKVTLPDGKPAKNVQVLFLPHAQGLLPDECPVKEDGTFSLKLIPGKYRYHFGAIKKNETAFAAIPEGYTETKNEHIVDVKPGTEIVLALSE